MRFEDERYIRLYTRMTTTSKKLKWEGRTVLREVFTHLDRAGILNLSKEPPAQAVSLLSDIPIEIVTAGLERCIENGCLVYIPDGEGFLLAPKFLEAQEAKSSATARQQVRRDRLKARSTLGKVASTAANPAVRAVLNAMLESDRQLPDSAEENDVGVTPRDGTVTPRDGTVTPRDGTVTPRDESSLTVTERHSKAKAMQCSADPILSDACLPNARDGADQPVHTSSGPKLRTQDYRASKALIDKCHSLGLDEGEVEQLCESYRTRGGERLATLQEHDTILNNGWVAKQVQIHGERLLQAARARERSNGGNRASAESTEPRGLPGAGESTSSPPPGPDPSNPYGPRGVGPVHKRAVERARRILLGNASK